MIKNFRLYNFKAFRNTGKIEIKPITVLAGPNSGGKSSILQSLLLLKQTLETWKTGIPLKLDGRFLQFSVFNELIFGKPRLADCEVRYRFKYVTTIPKKYIPRYFPSFKQVKGEHVPFLSDMDFSFKYNKERDKSSPVYLKRFHIRCSIDGIQGPQLTVNARGKGYNVKMLNADLPKQYRKMKINNVLLRNFLPGYFLLEAGKKKDRESSRTIIRIPPIFFYPIDRFGTEIEDKLRYLGPLREEPRRAYIHLGSPYPEIGTKGEYAAQILWFEKDNKVQYLASLDKKPRYVTLMEAVNDTFLQLGITEPFDVVSAKEIMYQILFKISGVKGKRQVTIADVGFGVSQLLPIVVMCLRSPKSALLLFEQPEIHLHPKLQANLGDFFLKLALTGKQLLIETHSDHLINRLRRRIAEDPSDKLKNKVNILFVRPSQKAEGSKAEPLKVDRYGVIENWPPEFLPESADEAEATFLASLKKRQKKDDATFVN